MYRYLIATVVGLSSTAALSASPWLASYCQHGSCAWTRINEVREVLKNNHGILFNVQQRASKTTQVDDIQKRTTANHMKSRLLIIRRFIAALSSQQSGKEVTVGGRCLTFHLTMRTTTTRSIGAIGCIFWFAITSI